MKQSHLERLALGLPADMQASFLDGTRDYSPDGNDPIEAFFAALNEARRRDTQAILEKLATDDTWKSQLREQLAKDRTANLEIRALIGTTRWKRIIASRIIGGGIGGGIWFALVLGLTPYVIKKQISTVDPEFHTMIEKLGEESKERLGVVVQNQKDTVKYIEAVNQATSLTTTNTSVGQVMARYITSIDRDTITLTVPDGSAGVRVLSVPHTMTDNEYVKFKLAYMVPKKVK
ncbi:MAG: hypothetical protein WCK77_12000 [Verrucomicrobiota bacterium]